ncbi:outer membrane beta-barrel protein [Pedobacter gandavensis]|uniref:outer membrane beta-barrel protein n=1 Tax=Pedobacter gandavensis TaxID=2679963 RepID=UPI002930B1F0|nr:outer membrane beta-barrel protein [Pedobacter gandavensis]
MKPNEHMKLPDDELIAHIKEQLMAHEEDYAPGAWENFNSNKPVKKRGMFFWLGSLSTAAALIMIGFAIFFMNKNERIIPLELSVTKESGQHSIPKQAESSLDVPSETAEVGKGRQPSVRANLVESVGGNTVANNNRVYATSPIEPAVTDRAKVVNANSANTNIQNNNLENPIVSTANPSLQEKAGEHTVAVVEAPIADKPQSLEDFLTQESKNGNARGKRPDPKLASLAAQEDKWEMGVMVAPSVGNSKKLNMGYGLSMGYALSKKVSINSGISYNEMAASRSAGSSSGSGAQDMPVAARGLAGNSKELKAVDANIRGIDIPLEIRYRFNKNLYANVGISAFAVLNQKQKNTFLESQVQNSPVDPQGISSTFKANVLSTTVTTEEQHTSELKTDPYLGFYNFSLGYKQKISRGKSVSLEPFVKLPIKEFTQENLYLIGTGLRLKFDF